MATPQPRTGRARPVRECPHTTRPHRHGTRAAYQADRCRCPACTAANTAHARARRRAHTTGQAPPGQLVDAAPARAHLAALAAAGIGHRPAAAAAHTSPRHLREIARSAPTPGGRPPAARITRRLADAILAVSPHRPAGGALVDPAGTRRRIQALIALGWPAAHLARALGRRTDSLARTLSAPAVTAATAAAAAGLYQALENTPPPPGPAAAAARARAAGLSWPAPLAWDDIDTDPTPPATTGGGGVDEIAVERALHGTLAWQQLTPAETTAAITRLAATGHSTRAIARILHTSRGTIRHHLTPTPRPLAAAAGR